LQFAGRTDTSLLREFIEYHGLEPGAAAAWGFFDCYVFLLDHYLRQSDGRVCVGAAEFLAAWQRFPQPPVLGLLTGNILLGAEIKLRHFGLWERFRVGAFGDDAEDRNELAAIALRRGREILGGELDPSDVLVVGDTVHDIACGRAIGAKVLAVATGGNTLADLAGAKPDWAVADLTAADVAAINRLTPPVAADRVAR
jgi:phosphoglycolate phosphatase-like HAD superfamily hydrolase